MFNSQFSLFLLLVVMRRVDKVCILAVYLQNIENHLPYQHGDREYNGGSKTQ